MRQAPTERPDSDSDSAKALKAETLFWFLLAVMGQWMFVVHIASGCAI
jgi:hypothetical protein